MSNPKLPNPKLPNGWHPNQFQALDYKAGDNRPVRCDTCAWEGHENDLTEVLYDLRDLHGRLTPGDEVPVGLCPWDNEGEDATCSEFVYYSDRIVAYKRAPNILDKIVEATE